jgi:hypothetical protein
MIAASAPVAQKTPPKAKNPQTMAILPANPPLIRISFFWAILKLDYPILMI